MWNVTGNRHRLTGWGSLDGGRGWKCLWFSYAQMPVCWVLSFFFLFTEQHRQALSGKPCQRRVPLIRVHWHGAWSFIHRYRSRGWRCWFKSCSRRLPNWLSHSSKDSADNLFRFLVRIFSSFKQLSRWQWINKCCFHFKACLWVHSFLNMWHCHLLVSACRLIQAVCFCSLLSSLKISDFSNHQVSLKCPMMDRTAINGFLILNDDYTLWCDDILRVFEAVVRICPPNDECIHMQV